MSALLPPFLPVLYIPFRKSLKTWAGNGALVECLPIHHKAGIVAHACNLSSWEAEQENLMCKLNLQCIRPTPWLYER